jgi:hypothetical protein
MNPDSTKASRARAINGFPNLGLPTQGHDIAHTKEAQYLLKTNRYGKVFYDGAIDGYFGPVTGGAAALAKDVLGYPDAAILHSFGAQLRSYLVPTSHPAYQIRPADYIQRGEARQDVPFRVVCFKRALSEVGYVEQPTNITKFGREYGMNGVPWCAIFVSCMIGFVHFRYSYVPDVVDDAKVRRNGLADTTEPTQGNLVCFDWNADGLADHIGFFGGWLDRSAGTFWTVEGNTSPDEHGSQSNGGGVWRIHDHPRHLANVKAFVTYR